MLELHGNSHVATIEEKIKETLGVMVEVRDSRANPAPAGAKFGSLYSDGNTPDSTEFPIPHGRTQIGNVEDQFEEHYGVKIRILTPNGEPADKKERYNRLKRRHSLSSGSLPPLAQWLNDVIQDKAIEVESLADQADVSTQTIRKIRTGSTENPHGNTIEKLQEALGEEVPPEVLEEVEEDAEIEGLGSLQDFEPWSTDEIPSGPGVYILYDDIDRPVYVGKSDNDVKARIRDHRGRKWFVKPFVESGAYVRIEDTDRISQVEKLLIKFLKSNSLVNEHHTEG